MNNSVKIFKASVNNFQKVQPLTPCLWQNFYHKSNISENQQVSNERTNQQIEFPSDAFTKYKKTETTGYETNNVAYGAAGISVAAGLIATKTIAGHLLKSMGPAKDAVALANIEVNIGSIVEGQCITVKWRGKPLFIKHRTQREIDAAKSAAMSDLKDPQPDDERVLAGKDNWLILIGICTHLGCVPLNGAGAYNGWFCPCHGSHYDTSGRIRKGPAPSNLEIPPYKFLDDETLYIGGK